MLSNVSEVVRGAPIIMTLKLSDNQKDVEISTKVLAVSINENKEAGLALQNISY
jgi:hypothetical protein